MVPTSTPSQRRAFLALLVACIGALALAPPAVAAGTEAPAPTTTPLVWVLTPHAVRDRPSLLAAVRETVLPNRPITGVRTALPVLSRRVDAERRVWLEVRLPGRTLGAAARDRSTGWIRASRTIRTTTSWHVGVQLATRRVVVSYAGKPVRSFRAIVGSVATPTPRGEFFVEENVALPASAVGQPFALATSARSSVLQEYAGGPGQIAFHGTGNVGGTLGTAVSHGCIRLSTPAISWLAARIRPGVPITIR